MRIFLNGEAVGQLPEQPASTDNIIYFISDSARHDVEEKEIPGVAALETMILHDDGSTRFESHDKYDCMCIMVPDLSAIEQPFKRILLYVAAGRLTLIYQDSPVVDALIGHMESTKYSSAEIPCLFLNILMHRDAAVLGDIEEEIVNLEDLVSADLSKNIPEQISKLRRRLLMCKKYYDSLFALLEDAEENTNGLFSAKQLRALHIQTNKADRLGRTMQSLRDHLTQVREAYQAQMDIQLNSVMKFFTVITSIFLPLTLIVGWYGMNLKMPEIAYPWMYPAVILLSIAVVAGGMTYFKFKRWF